MKKKGCSSQVVLKYALFQLPGLVLFFLILILVQRWTDLPLRFVWGLLVLWVVKDVVLFFFVSRAYQRVANPLIGMKGVAEEQLAPSGYVRVRGELWKVEVIDSNLQIDKGKSVKVQGIRGLTLLVEPYNDETIVDDLKKLSLRGAKRRACTPKWRYGTQAWQSLEIASLHLQ